MMTIAEFKAWMDGYSIAIIDAPTPDQWVMIKRKLDLVCEGLRVSDFEELTWTPITALPIVKYGKRTSCGTTEISAKTS